MSEPRMNRVTKELKDIAIRIRDGLGLMALFLLAIAIMLLCLESLAGQFGVWTAYATRAIGILMVAYLFGKMRDA